LTAPGRSQQPLRQKEKAKNRNAHRALDEVTPYQNLSHNLNSFNSIVELAWTKLLILKIGTWKRREGTCLWVIDYWQLAIRIFFVTSKSEVRRDMVTVNFAFGFQASRRMVVSLFLQPAVDS
jgi:hypothetical protein